MTGVGRLSESDGNGNAGFCGRCEDCMVVVVVVDCVRALGGRVVAGAAIAVARLLVVNESKAAMQCE